MSPVVFVLGIASWLAAVPAHNNPAEWKTPLPIPSSSQQGTVSTAHPVLVQALQGSELHLTNRKAFNQSLISYINSLPKESNSPGSGLEWERSDPCGGHLTYCSSFVRSAYASCGVSIPGVSLQAVKTYGRTINPNSPLEVGDIIFVAPKGSGHPAHIGIYTGDGKWKHPGGPEMPLTLDELPKQGYQVVCIKRLVSAVS